MLNNSASKLTIPDWRTLDQAYDNMKNSILEFCKLVSQHDDCQKEIAKRYKVSQPGVAQWVAIGKNADKFISIANNCLPTDYTALYEMTSLSKAQIKRLCAESKPTRKKIKEFKIGLLSDPAPKSTSDIDDKVEPAARLVPEHLWYCLSDFGKRAIRRDHEKIRALLNKTTQKMGKEILVLFLQLLNYHASFIEHEIKRRLPDAIKEREDALKARERKLEERERQLTARTITLRGQRVSEHDIKLIQSCLHPDKLPNGFDTKRYEKAFNAFRKWL